MPIPASTQLTEYLYISCRKKITAPPFGAPSAGARAYAPSALYPPPLDALFKWVFHDVDFKVLNRQNMFHFVDYKQWHLSVVSFIHLHWNSRVRSVSNCRFKTRKSTSCNTPFTYANGLALSHIRSLDVTICIISDGDSSQTWTLTNLRLELLFCDSRLAAVDFETIGTPFHPIIWNLTCPPISLLSLFYCRIWKKVQHESESVLGLINFIPACRYCAALFVNFLKKKLWFFLKKNLVRMYKIFCQ